MLIVHRPRQGAGLRRRAAAAAAGPAGAVGGAVVAPDVAGVLERRRRLVLSRETEALSLAALYKAIGGAASSPATTAGQR